MYGGIGENMSSTRSKWTQKCALLYCSIKLERQRKMSIRGREGIITEFFQTFLSEFWNFMFIFSVLKWNFRNSPRLYFLFLNFEQRTVYRQSATFFSSFIPLCHSSHCQDQCRFVPWQNMTPKAWLYIWLIKVHSVSSLSMCRTAEENFLNQNFGNSPSLKFSRCRT